jgi:hypothetical protein
MNVTPLPGAPRRAIRHDLVAPYDPSAITSLLAAGTSLDFMGSIFMNAASGAPHIDDGIGPSGLP